MKQKLNHPELLLTLPKIFRPDEALIFRSLPQQFVVIREMQRRYDALRGKGYSSHDAFYYAFVLTHPNRHGIATNMGASEFYTRMTRLLSSAYEMVDLVIQRYFGIFSERLSLHNTIANELDPLALLKMATDDPGPDASHLSRRRHFEARRQLAIALQLLSIETVDSESWVAEDLGEIERLSWERVFDPKLSEAVWVVAVLHEDSTASVRTKEVRIFLSTKVKKKFVRALQNAGLLFREDRLSCRVALLDGIKHYVYAVNRRKLLLSTLMKLERGRPYTDRRGWKYVVVGVENGSGLRSATPEDAVRFSTHTRNVLWQTPLTLERDVSSPNPDSNDRYKDEKTIGRFHRPDNGRIVAGPSEQLVTSIDRHVDTLVATDGLNHWIYRAGQVLRVIGPLWFPHRRGSYARTKNFRVPGYGVDWDAPSEIEKLKTWWQSQL
ncbi:MAG: hypothetical protein NUV84_03245 [Candidatus Uhrbacteria bacterium]|nr:hypothetical protein [Candidatus Uhrbacteria bacterium]